MLSMLMEDENLTLQVDEAQALSAIYGKAWTTIGEESRTYNMCFELDKQHEINLQVTLPIAYPTNAPPVYILSAPWLSQDDKLQLADALEDIYCKNIGQCILFQWTEKIREFIQETFPEGVCEKKKDNADVLDNALLQTVPLFDGFDELPHIVHGESVTHKKSTFQAHLAPVVEVNQVCKLLCKLKEDRKIANATHNMFAYRIRNEANKSAIQDCDDDGEKHAGSRLLHLLQILDVYNVIVVVSRWYGGVQLGPDRFRHISNVARDILLQNGYVKAASNDISPKKNRRSSKR